MEAVILGGVGCLLRLWLPTKGSYFFSLTLLNWHLDPTPQPSHNPLALFEIILYVLGAVSPPDPYGL